MSSVDQLRRLVIVVHLVARAARRNNIASGVSPWNSGPLAYSPKPAQRGETT